MSYVLDALKKADAERERERGAVPGLGTQPLPAAGSAATTHPAELRRPWLLAAALALLLMLGVAGWLGWSRGSGAPPQPPVASAPPVPLRPAPAATAAAQHQPMKDAPAGPPAVSSADAITAAPATRIVEGPLPAPPPPPPAPRPAAAAAAAPANATRGAAAAPSAPATAGAAAPTSPTTAARGGAATPSANASAPVAAATTTPTAAAAAIVTPDQLPPELRAVFPHIAISGAMHAPNPAQRLLFVGSQVFREGDPLGELKLERIEAHAAVFRFRGRLVRVGF